jgi:hypothetical protein
MNVKTADEIARPVFQESDNGPVSTGAMLSEAPARAEVEEPPKKKEPTLKRRNQIARSAPTEKAPTMSASHSRMIELLAVGNYRPEDLVSLALDEGWLTPEQGSFEKIPEDRMTEFLREENWNYVMQCLDERAAKQQIAAAERGNLL